MGSISLANPLLCKLVCISVAAANYVIKAACCAEVKAHSALPNQAGGGGGHDYQ